jgi:glucan phosphoethanolaminetransferase (alkaline phosphatase superfamily)
MLRSLVGFAIFAIVALVAIRIVTGLLGIVLSLAMQVLWLAIIGFVFYTLVRSVSPSTADRIKEMIQGKPAT